jgi:hypothetical protein
LGSCSHLRWDRETLELVDAFCAAERQFDAVGLRKSEAEATAENERQSNETQRTAQGGWTATQFNEWLDQLSSLDDELIRVCDDWRKGRATEDAVRSALANGTTHREMLRHE